MNWAGSIVNLSMPGDYNVTTEGLPTVTSARGPLWNSQCRMSILRNGNVARLCRFYSPMSNVQF